MPAAKKAPAKKTATGVALKLTPVPAAPKTAPKPPQAKTVVAKAAAKVVKSTPPTKASKPVKAAAPAAKTPAAKPAKAEKSATDKARKPKLVRDSFTIPKDEYAALDTLKARAAKLGRPAKKSEVLRAGLLALTALGDSGFADVIKRVPAIKTGRPSKA